MFVEGFNKWVLEIELVGKSDKGYRVIFFKVFVMDGFFVVEVFEEGCNLFDRKVC